MATSLQVIGAKFMIVGLFFRFIPQEKIVAGIMKASLELLKESIFHCKNAFLSKMAEDLSFVSFIAKNICAC